MDIIKASSLKMDFLTKSPNGIPMVFLKPSARTIRKLQDAGYKEISLNQELSSLLMELPAKQRASAVMRKSKDIIEQRRSPVLIRDFEMLFDPEYQLDVLKMFCKLARLFRIAVIWCGTLHDNILEFAEPEYPDYQSYHTDQYEIYCIQ